MNFSDVFAIHLERLAEHGGLEGIRDQAAIESALARPQNIVAYGDPDAADLAAAYVYGIAKNHGFADGNKRTSFVTAMVFLGINGFEPDIPIEDVVHTINSVASSEISEEQLADWFRSHIAKG
jgi:death-on-curing protein